MTVQNESASGLRGMLGKIVAQSRRMRERAFFNRVIDELLPYKAGHLRALDVGCGGGYLMSALRRAGWDVEGIEWDPEAATRARQGSGCLVREGDFREIQIPPETYDLVVLSHVFEHIADPIEAMHNLNRFLKPGGRLVLIYPNPESLGARLFRDNWFPWEAPRHFVFPTSWALAVAAGRVGLSVVKQRTLAREAALFFALSRAYRLGKLPDLARPELSLQDRFAAAVEGMLVRLGFPIGEEIIVVLKKDSVESRPQMPN